MVKLQITPVIRMVFIGRNDRSNRSRLMSGLPNPYIQQH